MDRVHEHRNPVMRNLSQTVRVGQQKLLGAPLLATYFRHACEGTRLTAGTIWLGTM